MALALAPPCWPRARPPAPTSGTTDDSCYLALPTAAKAVGGHGHLEGVRKYTLSNLHSMAPRLYGRLAHDVPKKQAICVAGYTGHFTCVGGVRSRSGTRRARWRWRW